MKHFILLLSLAFAGCVSIPSPFSSGVYVTVDGGQSAAPAHDGKVLVYYKAGTPQIEDSQQLAQAAITTWLQKRGVVVLTLGRDVILDEQKFRLTYGGDASPLKIGRLHGADLVVRFFVEPNQISVEGVNVETGEIAWSGSAISTSGFGYRESPRRTSYLASETRGPLWVNPVTMRKVVCHALAAAWGLETPGTYDLYKDDAC